MLDLDIISPPQSPTGETGGDDRFVLCLSVSQSVCLSVRPSHSFSGLFLAMLWYIWMKVGSKLVYEVLQIKFDFYHDWPFFHELLPFAQNLFSELFSAMLSHIWMMKVGRKLPYEELQIKFDFHHGWPTFSWVIALCSKFVFLIFLGYAFTYLNESW